MARRSTTESGSTAAPRTKKRRWYHDFVDAYKITARAKPALPWILLGTVLGTTAVFVLIGLLIDWPVYLGIIGFLVGLVLAMVVLTRMTRTAAYSRVEGQPGAVSAAMGQMGRGWYVEEEPVAFNVRFQDMVFRAVGRPGVVLISEGPPHRVGRMLAEEKKKVARVASGVPIHLVQCGREEGQVPLPDLVGHVRKLKGGKLSPAEISAVTRRLAALGGIRQSVPKGIDPNRARPDRRAQRGR